MVKKAGNIGIWESNDGLPVFHLTKALAIQIVKGNTDSYIDNKKGEPVDPWFILGNYGLTVFTHASGGYQLMSGERGFARLNHSQADKAVDWACHANIMFNKQVTELIGLESEEARNADKYFGCGYAQYKYKLDNNINCTRILSTVPSENYKDRISAMKISVEVENNGEEAIALTYREGLDACYDFANKYNPPVKRRYSSYPVKTIVEGNCITAEFEPVEKRPLVFAEYNERAQADGHPPLLHLELIKGENVVVSTTEINNEKARMEAVWDIKLAPGEKKTLCLAVGYSLPDLEWKESVARLNITEEAIMKKWAERLPEFSVKDEKEGEMLWHAYVLYAMANWDDFYKESFIPQGNVYEYALGIAACSRDHLQHCLPLCYYDQDLAKSILRFITKHTDVYGRIRHNDEGLGFIPRGGDEKSDSQLYAFMVLAEYLRINKDSSFLLEEVEFDGMVGSGTILDRVILWMRYFMDFVSTGPNGLVRLMNADWNDCCVKFFKDVSYNQMFATAESYLNTTMAVNVLQNLYEAFQSIKSDACLEPVNDKVNSLMSALGTYRKDLFEALMNDWKGTFIPRARMHDQVLGLDEMYLEPQPYLLGIEKIPLECRHDLWKEIEKRLWKDEKKGARQREKPGTREKGGVWYALNGPLVTNLKKVDINAAYEALDKLTLSNHAKNYPDYWIGMWSGVDSFNSDHIEGRVNGYISQFPAFCAHAHAWPLYGWLYLNE